MTFSPRAVEAGARAIYERAETYPKYALRQMNGLLASDLALAAITAYHAALAMDGLALQGWRTIDSAPKNGTPVLAKFFDDIYPRICPNRDDLERWNGLQVVLRHSGLADNGFDIGWSVAAPVGNGGFPDEWIEGWMPLPLTAASDGGGEVDG